ncbi:MAG TPA: hypothetical protein VGA18_08190 [Rhodothermales bacterium]
MGLFDRLLGREQVTAVIPTGAVIARFRAVQDFWSEEVRSQYSAGSVYSVRQGNEKLDHLVREWKTEGKVEVL